LILYYSGSDKGDNDKGKESAKDAASKPLDDSSSNGGSGSIGNDLILFL
jgi:hypothetical protein